MSSPSLNGSNSIGIFCIYLLQWVSIHAADLFIGAPGIGTGNTFALEPFALRQLGVPSIRYQQVYNASEFLREIPQGGIITELIFRSDREAGRVFITAYPRVQIDLSVTLRSADGLSGTFAENIGSSTATVYPASGLTLGGDPGSASTSISLQVPYAYNPVNGNLLLDIMIFSPEQLPVDPSTTAGPMDAENNGFGPDTVSRVFAYDVNATSGTADSIGLITFFRVTPIPEPSTTALLLAALMAAGMCGSRPLRRRFKR